MAWRDVDRSVVGLERAVTIAASEQNPACLQAHDSQEAISAELVDLCGDSPVAGGYLSMSERTTSPEN